MSRYLVNFAKVAELLLPPFLRNPKMLAWLKALVKPIQVINTDFLAFIRRIRYRIRFNGQVIYLEHLLNDFYDPTLRRIYLADGDALGLPQFIYNRVENRSLFVRNQNENSNTTPPFLRNRNEYVAVVDFIVFVPSDLLVDAEMARIIRATVNQYRLGGKRFLIQGF